MNNDSDQNDYNDCEIDEEINIKNEEEEIISTRKENILKISKKKIQHNLSINDQQSNLKPTIRITKFENKKPEITKLPLKNSNSTQLNIENAIKRLLEFSEIPPVQFHPQIKQLLTKQSLLAIAKTDYDFASKCEEAKKLLGNIYEDDLNTSRKIHLKENYDFRLNNLIEQLSKLNKEWDSIFKTFWEEQKQKKYELENKHKNEQIEFEQLWDDPNTFLPFNKPSPQLLQLRKIQKKLAMAKSFDQAKIIKIQADELQNKETEEAEKRALENMENSQLILIDKHRKEIECFNEKEKRTEIYLKGEKFKEVHPLEMQIQQLKLIIDTEKKNLLLKNNLKSTLKNKIEIKDQLPPNSPRTARVYQKFRNNDEPIKLNINSTNVKKAFEKRRATSNLQKLRK